MHSEILSPSLPPILSIIDVKLDKTSFPKQSDNRKINVKLTKYYSELGLEEERQNSFATRVVLELSAVVPVLAQSPLSHLAKPSKSEQKSCNKGEYNVM
jgi:hypothetical protein